MRGNHVYGNKSWGLWCDIDCINIIYENNLVEHNYDAGIYHEISFRGVIRNNTLRHNGVAGQGWLWGADIVISASQDVEVFGNDVTVRPDGCGAVLIDQSRDKYKVVGKYKTHNNRVYNNKFTFEGHACAGGASDVAVGDENYSIISEGNNIFDGNIYRIPQMAGTETFVWGHETVDWPGFRKMGLELNGQLQKY
jgi:parallel beta-helix repeat protein